MLHLQQIHWLLQLLQHLQFWECCKWKWHIFVVFFHYQRSYLHMRSSVRKQKRTCVPLLNQWERGSLSLLVCRPSQSRKMFLISGARHCRPSQLESSKQRPLVLGPEMTNVHPFLTSIFKRKPAGFINWIFNTFFYRTSRFASFPEYLVVQIKKFTFGVDWVPKKLGN